LLWIDRKYNLLLSHLNNKNTKKGEKMSYQNWDTPYWPEGVPHQIEDYKFPLFELLDRTAKKYPNNIFTIFSDGKRTYGQVKDTSDRISNFLASKGIKKGTRSQSFFPTCRSSPKFYLAFSKQVQFQ
jgi:long-chain acyl-CoA synthetase